LSSTRQANQHHVKPAGESAGQSLNRVFERYTLSNDIPGQLSNFGGEQAGWGPLELTNYGFDLRIHNFARVIKNPCR